MSDPETSPAPAAAPTDPAELLRSRSYLVLLGFGASWASVAASSPTSS